MTTMRLLWWAPLSLLLASCAPKHGFDPQAVPTTPCGSTSNPVDCVVKVVVEPDAAKGCKVKLVDGNQDTLVFLREDSNRNRFVYWDLSPQAVAAGYRFSADGIFIPRNTDGQFDNFKPIAGGKTYRVRNKNVNNTSDPLVYEYVITVVKPAQGPEEAPDLERCNSDPRFQNN